MNPDASPIQIMVFSDLHYLAKELYRDSPLFLSTMARGDGQIPQYSDELMQAFCQEALRLHPDALLITGDLTWNGERESHRQVAASLQTIRQKGIPVYLIPGNHDIANQQARAFRRESVEPVENVTPEMFYDLYRDFMLLPHGDVGPGMSYVIHLTNKLWIIMLDVCVYREKAQIGGLFTDAHEAWLSEKLHAADEAGATVITASHHGLLPHTRFAQEHFVIQGHERMETLLRQHHVHLHLSGHLHAQHIAQDAGLTDAALGGCSITPHRYAWLTIHPSGKMVYDARQVDDDVLPDGFQKISQEWYESVALANNRRAVASLPLTSTEKDQMATFSAKFHRAYFSGFFQDSCRFSWQQDSAYALWQQYPVGIFGAYFRQVIREKQGDHLHWESTV